MLQGVVIGRGRRRVSNPPLRIDLAARSKRSGVTRVQPRNVSSLPRCLSEVPRGRTVTTSNGPLDELRRQESARRIEERRYRFTLILAVAPVSAAMALAALYITVPAAFAERHVYSEIARPPLWEFMRSAAVVPIAGALLGSLLAFIATDLLGVPRSPARLLITLLAVGVIFGLFVPLATALVLPINLLLVDVATNVGDGEELVDDLLAASIRHSRAAVCLLGAGLLHRGRVGLPRSPGVVLDRGVNTSRTRLIGRFQAGPGVSRHCGHARSAAFGRTVQPLRRFGKADRGTMTNRGGRGPLD